MWGPVSKENWTDEKLGGLEVNSQDVSLEAEGNKLWTDDWVEAELSPLVTGQYSASV